MSSIGIVDRIQLDPRFYYYQLIYLCIFVIFYGEDSQYAFMHLVQTFCGVLYAAIKY